MLRSQQREEGKKDVLYQLKSKEFNVIVFIRDKT